MAVEDAVEMTEEDLNEQEQAWRDTRSAVDETVRDIFATEIKQHLNTCINNRIVNAISVMQTKLDNALAIAKCANKKVDELLIELKEKENEDE